MIDKVRDFYQSKYSENERMVRKPLEFARCKEIISRYVSQEPMEITDIGGATGVFSYWLAQMNHSVHLLDYTPSHLAQAKENGKKLDIALASCTCGDARELPYRDGQFDLALLMGPLYHLQDKNDRMCCLQEARRVLKDDAIVICEVISRYANLFEGFHNGLIDDERFVEILDENLATGKHSPGDTPYFTTAYFHTPNEIQDELKEAGFTEISLIPVEGFFGVLDANEIFADARKKELLLKYIRETEKIRELFGSSAHLIAVGKK